MANEGKNGKYRGGNIRFLLDEFCYCPCGFRAMGLSSRSKLHAEPGAGLEDIGQLEMKLLDIDKHNCMDHIT